MIDYEHTWKPKEGELVVASGTREEMKKVRCSPDGPIHFVHIIPEPSWYKRAWNFLARR